MPMVGYVGISSAASEGWLAGVRRGLATLGFVEGQNYRFELRYANNDYERFPIAFRELSELRVAVFVVGTTLQLEAAKAATQSIPIIFQIGSDPVENGFVASINRPGGNLTGIFNLNTPMTAKRVEVLRELVPSLTKFAFLTIPNETRVYQIETKAAQAAADILRLDLLIVNAVDTDGLDGAFATSVRKNAGGIVVGSNGKFFGLAKQLATMTARYRLPAIFVEDGPVREGGLVSYGVDQEEARLLTGNYVGRILKGEKPADMPVQQSSKTKLTINLNAAKAFGITVPTQLLGRADEVIE
jgi:putative ABC transport system substrate-binding protein